MLARLVSDSFQPTGSENFTLNKDNIYDIVIDRKETHDIVNIVCAGFVVCKFSCPSGTWQNHWDLLIK